MPSEFIVDVPYWQNTRNERLIWVRDKKHEWKGWVNRKGMLLLDDQTPGGGGVYSRYAFVSANDAVEFKLLFG